METAVATTLVSALWGVIVANPVGAAVSLGAIGYGGYTLGRMWFSTPQPAPAASPGPVAPASPEEVAEALAAPAPAIPHDAPLEITTTAAELAARTETPVDYFRFVSPSRPTLEASLQAAEYRDAAYLVSRANIPPEVDPEVALVLYRAVDAACVREFARHAALREEPGRLLRAAIREYGLAHASPGPSGWELFVFLMLVAIATLIYAHLRSYIDPDGTKLLEPSEKEEPLEASTSGWIYALLCPQYLVATHPVAAAVVVVVGTVGYCAYNKWYAPKKAKAVVKAGEGSDGKSVEGAPAIAKEEVSTKTADELSSFDQYYLDLFSNQYAQTYLGLALYIFLALALCALLATLAYLLSLSTSQDTEKRSEYECGFAPFDSATRLPFDVHFYLVGILFLIFDVEVALLFPWVLSLNTIGWFGFYTMLAFLFILSVGFLYEWKRGALIWPARYSAVRATLSDSNWLFIPVWPNLLELARMEDLSLTFIDFFLPELLLAIGVIYFLTVIALELGEGRSKIALSPECWAAVRVNLAATSALLVYQLLIGILSAPTLGDYFFASQGADLLKSLTCLSTLFVVSASGKYLKEHYQHTLEYPIMVTLTLWFMLLLVQANHLISAFLCVVGFSLNLYVLILYDIAVRPSREAGLKYYYLSTLSSGLILYGVFMLYALSGDGEFGELYSFFLQGEARYSSLVRVAVLLTIFGFFFKLSAVPAHLWAVEVYEGSPSPITALFMLPVKVSVLAVFTRLLTLALSGLSHVWIAPLLFAVSASLLWGAFAATYERNTKRFLGYASINQIGYLLLGLGCGTDAALRGSLIYLFVYVLMSAAFLLVFIHARRADYYNLNYTSDFRGLAKKEWIASWTLAIVLFSMAGIPPLTGFYAKYAVLVSAMGQGLYVPAVVALATSLLGAFYYLRFIRTFWFEDTSSVFAIACDMGRAKRLGLSLMEIMLWSGAVVGPALLPFLKRATAAFVALFLLLLPQLSITAHARPFLTFVRYPYAQRGTLCVGV